MADTQDDSKQATGTVEVEPLREPFPEEVEEPSKSAKGFFRRHPFARWILLFALLLLAALGAYLWHYFSIHETTDDAQIDGHIGPISARISGTVTNVYVDDNYFVKEGQLLVKLDPRDYEVALQHVQGDLADAQASARAAEIGVPINTTTTSNQVRTSQADVNAANKEVDSAKARVREAEANYTKAAQDLKRFQILVAKDEISQQQYDTALATEQAARATLDAARAAVATAESRVAQAEAGLRTALTAPQQVAATRARASAAQAAVKTREAAVAQAQLNLQYTEIRAPFTGIVSKRNVEPGQVIQPGQPLFSIVNIADLWTTANFKETQLKHMRVGQAAKIHVDAFGRDYYGHIDSMGGATGARFSLLPPENATGNYVKVVQRVPVKIVFDKGEDPGRQLRPGMSVDATVITK
ncbi:MAG TPA: HlyD family secretion protein [Terriglobales bacterium]|nr:HlyD family secretion protein [Terriglobales bacterium]